MIEIGKSLPNWTVPAVTTGATRLLAVKRNFLFRARDRASQTLRVSNIWMLVYEAPASRAFSSWQKQLQFAGKGVEGSTLISAFEYQGCTRGDVGRHDEPPAVAL